MICIVKIKSTLVCCPRLLRLSTTQVDGSCRERLELDVSALGSTGFLKRTRSDEGDIG